MVAGTPIDSSAKLPKFAVETFRGMFKGIDIWALQVECNQTNSDKFQRHDAAAMIPAIFSAVAHTQVSPE